MFETPFTIVGTIVTDLVRRKVGDQEVVKFRVASNSRRRTADGSWEPGNSLFVTVNCWGRLVTGVAGSLRKGLPVIVSGYVYTSEYEDREGNRRSSVEVRATAVGPDLSRSIAAVENLRLSGPGMPGDATLTDGTGASPAHGAADVDDGGAAETDEATRADAATDPADVIDAEALPLSA